MIMQVNKMSSENLLEQVHAICNSNNPCIVVLTSMDIEVRNRWMRAFEEAHYLLWAHSMRVIRHIKDRLHLEEENAIDSVYNVIYGGFDSEDEDSQSNEPNDNNSEEIDDGAQVIIPVKRSNKLDDNSTIVFCEAQLLSQNLNQTELIRYGSGRLLDDVLSFVFEKGNRTLILIGDPYYLTYGKSTDSSLHIDTLVEKLPNVPIYCYDDGISENPCPGKQELRTLLASGIERQCFNSLHYDFSSDLENIKRESLEPILIDWFSQPLSHDPQNAALFYTNNDCYLTNMWIKKHCLKNGEDLAIGDLLIMNNNITISADLPIDDPIKIYNGMYLTLLGIIGHDDKTIQIRTKGGIINVSLNFTKMKVKCLSIERTPEKDIFMLDNYFKADELTKNEQIALRVYCNELIREKIREKELSFTGSIQYQNMVDSDEFKDLSPDEKRAIYDLANNVGIEKRQQKEVHTTNNVRKIFRRYRHKWEMNIRKQILDTDPYLNSAWLSYGWAITVHKSLGVYFNSIWFKGSQNANSGYSNDNYYRWLYSGVTASNETVYLSSPQIITPLMNCQIDDVENDTLYTGGFYLVFHEKSVKDINNSIITSANISDNAKILINELSKELQKNSYVLKAITRKSCYLTLIEYTLGVNNPIETRLLIDNKGENDNYAVSNVRFDGQIGQERKMLMCIIRQCMSNEWPTDFRKDIYDTWNSKLQQYSLYIVIAKSQEWHDTLIVFNYEGERVAVEVWYNKDGFLTKIKFIANESEYVYDILKKIINEL
jgi:hypothetical protein